MSATINNPVDMTMPASYAWDWTEATKTRMRRAIGSAAAELLTRVRDECVGSAEVVRVDWDRLTLMGPVEQCGDLATQRGYVTVSSGPLPGTQYPAEMGRIMREIWGEYLDAIDGHDLQDRAAVAALLGVDPDTISRYRQPDRREAFPEPDLRVGGHPAWRRSTIEAWRAARPGRTGRPPSLTRPTPTREDPK